MKNTQLVYSGDRTQSPIDAELVKHLNEIVARGAGRPSVFSKVGDSISSNGPGVSGGHFLNCFAGTLEGQVPWEFNVKLGEFTGLARTITFFSTPMMGTEDSWTRVSLATHVGRTAGWAIKDTPSPLEQELAEAQPRYAIVMFGSNDIVSTSDENGFAGAAEVYERAMRDITDQLLAKGVIPLLTTMPPDQEYLRYAPAYSGVVRAIAQGRQIPLIDFQKELLAIPAPHGLGADGVHPSCADFNTCCWFDPQSLGQYGYNVRNLITLQALDRLHQVMDLGVTGIDSDAVHLTGDGSPAAPFEIASLPWGELRNLAVSPTRVSGESACGTQAVEGPQYLYKVVLSQPTKVRALLLDRFNGHQRLSLLSGKDLSTCVRSDPRLIQGKLEAGTWYFAVTPTSDFDGTGNDYNFSITECRDGDADCQ